MATLQALLRSDAPLRGEAVDQLIRTINRLMYGSTDGSKYATFFYGLYDDSRRLLEEQGARPDHDEPGSPLYFPARPEQPPPEEEPSFSSNAIKFARRFRRSQ